MSISTADPASLCTSVEGFSLGPGGFDCAQLVSDDLCTDTGGEGPAWRLEEWGPINLFTMDGLTAAQACCGCGAFCPTAYHNESNQWC